MVIFLGDFIDRGPHQREVIEIDRQMIEAGTAQSVMGNHEFNAIACLDYSVAKPAGRLTAYRWGGEQVLKNERFVWVERGEGGD